MKQFIQLEIKTTDHAAITIDILTSIHQTNVNLTLMEVFKDRICINLEYINDHTKNLLIKNLLKIRDVLTIKEINLLNNEENAFKNIIGTSLCIQKVKKFSSTVGKSNSTILLRGEGGTGKELFAKAIHNYSYRKNKKFITLNCSSIPDIILESELFGYEEGRFIGDMNSSKDGLFKEANGGTIFLDEIGEFSITLQAKLLKVLQEGTIKKLGSNKEETVDIRIIAATNRNLEEMVKNGQFREDLYYRLNIIPIYLPPLRERLEDIPLLVKFFMSNLNNKLKKRIEKVDFQVYNKLMQYHWPGNIRELQNIVERAMNLCEGEILTPENIIFNFSEYNSKAAELFYTEELTLKEITQQCEKEAIIRVLDKYKSYRKAAQILGVSHTTIMNKTKKYFNRYKV
ncbi:hypothetical protein CPJCM30710_16140 [Clostridium polyendosporum]|uniref:HTH-type transcriptional regulatory protein TyrR n=1 Tax=Clostridium polyendosporum TaxID=69208 RepID=A0A919S0C6_9CLOT|nr:sigma 54-interacting transcriptional regulator [Clostridium polyendosporum]GIM28948.1 hypothetical protein CPJCM30710_16140 [Clostridium polyendosporum]